MKIEKIKIEGFRKHISKEITFHDLNTSVIIGGNNVGKTSIIDALSYVVFSKDFKIHDFFKSTESFKSFYKKYTEKTFSTDDEKKEYIKENSPRINLQIEFKIERNDKDIYGEVVLNLSDYIENDRFFYAYGFSLLDKVDSAIDYLDNHNNDFDENILIDKCYTYNKIMGNENEDNTPPIDFKINELIELKYLEANLAIDESVKNISKTNVAVKKILSSIIGKNKILKDNLERTVDEFCLDIQNTYETDISNKFINIFKKFGFEESKSGKLNINLEVELESILTKALKVFYDITTEGNTYVLPENYNGLGYNNLLYMLIQIYTFISEVESNSKPIMLLCVEEPETHMHPEMEKQFITRIQQIKELYIELFESEKEIVKQKLDTSLQLIITTHSANIVSNANYNNLIFVNDDKCINFVDLDSDDQFALQYLTIEKTEALFSKRVILVEGDVERILIPYFIENLDFNDKLYSIVQVNGTHFQMFIDLYNKISSKVLIVTDLDIKDEKFGDDSIDRKNVEWGESWRKTPLETTNSFLSSYFDKDICQLLDNEITVLNSEIDNDNIFVTTQRKISEDVVEGKVLVGRTFEEQFLLENMNNNLLINKTLNSIKNYSDFFDENNLSNCSYGIYRFIDRNKRKLDFTFEIIENIEEFSIPKYIEEGLKWLME